MHTNCTQGHLFVCISMNVLLGGGGRCFLPKGIADPYNKDWEPPQGQNCFLQQSKDFVNVKIPALPPEKEPPRVRSVLFALCPRQ